MTRQRSGDPQRMRDMQAVAQNTPVQTRQRSGGLERMQAMQSTALDQTNAFSVFCIGTGHTADEPNNTIGMLGRTCKTPHYINDGPGKGGNALQNMMGTAQGWGMNDKLAATMEAIKSAPRRPDVVVMTGHSRGAILCHMIAYALAEDKDTRSMTVKMIVLDPVHQSWMNHEGAEELHKQANIESYYSIIMENEDVGPKLTPFFPFKFVEGTESQQKRMHYIPMPGSHGSGTQSITNPVGQVTMDLIATYMRARGTKFSLPVPTDLEMCERFADIHVLNPRNALTGKREVWNDEGDARVHLGTMKMRTTDYRQKDLHRARLHNQQHQVFDSPIRPGLFDFGYFFNEEHANYFRKCFPYFYRVLSAAPGRSPRNYEFWKRDFDIMMSQPSLKKTFNVMLRAQLETLFM